MKSKYTRSYADEQRAARESVAMLKAQLESAQMNNNQLHKRIGILAAELRDMWAIRDWLMTNGYGELFDAARVAIRLERGNADETT